MDKKENNIISTKISDFIEYTLNEFESVFKVLRNGQMSNVINLEFAQIEPLYLVFEPSGVYIMKQDTLVIRAPIEYHSFRHAGGDKPGEQFQAYLKLEYIKYDYNYNTKEQFQAYLKLEYIKYDYNYNTNWRKFIFNLNSDNVSYNEVRSYSISRRSRGVIRKRFNVSEYIFEEDLI